MSAWRLYRGDCMDLLRSLKENSVDSIVCDPPYGLGFMGQGWDASVPGLEWARECIRVLKPGGHLVAFGGTRTVHRLVCAVEDAGFEVRDQVGWTYYSGFPKSLDVSKAIDAAAGAVRARVRPVAVPSGQRDGTHALGGGWQSEPWVTAPATDDARRWSGWGTALKPAFEPAVLARKPFRGTVAANVVEYGTAAINVDGCRFGYGDPAWVGPQGEWTFAQGPRTGRAGGGIMGTPAARTGVDVSHELGRWPANLYACPKASRSERERGCDGLPPRTGAEAVGREEGSAGLTPRAGAGRSANEVRNHHCTVKPVRLMRWLCRLVTPPGGLVLDPFAGSGSCGVAAVLEGFRYLGAELEPEYADIAEARIAHAVADPLAWRITAPGHGVKRPATVPCEVEPEPAEISQMALFGGVH
jgi:DNA modification methylase